MLNLVVRRETARLLKVNKELARGTKQAMYVRRDTEVPSRNYCCSGRVINVTYSACVFAALVIQHEKRMLRTTICGLSRLHSIFPHYSTNGTILGKQVIRHKM